MKVRAIAFSAFLLAAGSLFSQEKETKEAIAYSNITEFGFITVSPRGIGIEATTVQGFSIGKEHCLGLGIGIGGSFHKEDNTAYMPVFINYRLYFRPHKPFSPHVNISVGGLTATEGYGIYSSLTMGFRAGHFSFSSGFSFTPRYYKREYDSYSYFSYSYHYYSSDPIWIYPIGITLKCGFSF